MFIEMKLRLKRIHDGSKVTSEFTARDVRDVTGLMWGQSGFEGKRHFFWSADIKN